MRKYIRRCHRSDNVSRKVVMPTLRRHRLSDVVTVSVSINDTDDTAKREGTAIIRRGRGARSDKAFHDSILWNKNVRKIWVRRMLELSDQTEILKFYLQNVER